MPRPLAAALGLAAITAYLAIALSRLGYPFVFDRLESNSLIEVRRILAGQPLYAAPTVSYVPDGYPPLYFTVAAPVASILGLSYLPLRLVSLLSSLAGFALLTRLVHRETASLSAGIAAAGLFAATYFVTGTWFDLARVDSLFLTLSIAALYAARWMRTARGAILAGLLLAAAALTKQSGLAEGVAVLSAAAFGPQRRLAALAALCWGTVVGISTVVLQFASHGWYLYYVVQQMSGFGLRASALGQFWIGFLLPTVGLAVFAAVLAVRRTHPVLLAGCAALLAEGLAALAHKGAAPNDLLPGCLVVAVFAGLAMADRPGALLASHADRLASGRIPGWQASRTGQCLAQAASVLIIAQMAMLLTGFRPGRAAPADDARAAGARLIAGMRALGGTVAVLSDPGLDLIAGLPTVAQQNAVSDVMRGAGAAAIASYTHSAAAAVQAQRFSALIIMSTRPLRGFPTDLGRYYRRCPQPLRLGVARALQLPTTEARVQKVWVWLPTGRDSCAAAVRAFGGTAVSSPTASRSPPRHGLIRARPHT